MNKKGIIILLILLAAVVFAETPGGAFGIQLSSDTDLQAVLRLKKSEAGLGVQANLGDGIYGNQGLLKVKGYMAYRFVFSESPLSFTLGVEAGTALGLDDLEYDEYIDIGPRLGLNYNLNGRFRISGILYPLWLSTREVTNVEDGWGLQVVIPRAAAAVTYFF